MFLVSPLLFGALVVQSTASASGPEAQIVCSGPLPFSQAEIEEALRARQHLLGSASRIVVHGEDGGRTVVRVGRAERQVALDGRAGEDAARLVAVLALDLAQADAPLMLSADASGSTAVTSGRAIRLGAALHCPFDQAGAAHLEPTVDVALDVGGVPGLAGFVTAGYRHVSAGAGPTALGMHEFPLRAGVAYRWEWLELRLGAGLRPRVVDGAGGHVGATWGGGVSGAAHHALSPKLDAVLAAGLDVSRDRTVFAVDHDQILATAWLAPWVSAGLVWEAAP